MSVQQDPFYILFLIFEVLEIFAIFFSIFFFFLRYYLDAENREFFNTLRNFSEKLNLNKKIIFFIFIFTFAIPNKVYVNNQSNFIVQVLINFLVMSLCSIWPPLIFIFLVRIKVALESYIFGYICSYTPSLRAIVIKHLFNEDEAVANDVFDFFWGNMIKGAKAVFTTGAVGGFLYKAVKSSEFKNIETETDKRVDRDWQRLIQDPRRAEITQHQSHKSAVEELQEIKRNARQEAIDTTTITAIENRVQKASLIALDVFMKKYS
jgi:hypothetical protein